MGASEGDVGLNMLLFVGKMSMNMDCFDLFEILRNIGDDFHILGLLKDIRMMF